MRKKIFSLLAVVMLMVMSLGFVGCGANETNALSINTETVVVTVDDTLDQVLAGVTLTYKDLDGEEPEESYTGLSAMREAGASVIWSGSSKVGKEGTISFAYKGYRLTIDYTVAAKN